MDWTRPVLTRRQRLQRQARFRMLTHAIVNLIVIIEIVKLL